jgi:UDP-N-acetylmuramyl-tripeptide synthetase
MTLAELLRGVADGPALEIAEVRDDSRAVGPGDLFVALRGQTVDGHKYLGTAFAQGAAAALVEVKDPAVDGLQIVVPSTARALALVAANRYGRPAEAMKLIGVTGTNGKTTTTFLVEALLRASGARPGVIGTVSYRFGERSWPAPFTTPTPLELHKTLHEMRASGATHVVMECSSHALALDRLYGLCFAVSAFTNLTQDHLDFHGSMEAYRDAKALLFREYTDGRAAVLIDREHAAFMAAAAGPRLLAVSAHDNPRAAVRVASARHSIAGIEAELATPAGPLHLRSPLIGAFNLENLVVAVGVGLALGLSPTNIGAALDGVRGAPGRMERVGDAPVFVDYAHTPDALERVMAALRPLTEGRLLVVFGCGGDRDRTKRPKMGAAVARDADLGFVTSDNPRTEDPDSIIQMILEGMHGARPVVEPDRRKAIQLAVAEMRPGDALIIAGKGHEDYQILGKTKVHFDDREEARAALQNHGQKSGAATENA